MTKRSTSIPAIRVLPQTRTAMREAIKASGLTAVRWQLEAYALKAGQTMTSEGQFNEVIAREIER